MSDAMEDQKLKAIRARHAAACVYGRPTRHEEPVEAHNDRAYLLNLLTRSDDSSQEYYLSQIDDILDNERWSRLEHCNAIYDLFAHLLLSRPATAGSEGEAEAYGQRRVDLLEWVERSIGTAWDCACGASTYHQFGFECQECGKQAPDLHVVAFRLGAAVSDPAGDPGDKVELENLSSDDLEHAYQRGIKATTPAAAVTQAQLTRLVEAAIQGWANSDHAAAIQDYIADALLPLLSRAAPTVDEWALISQHDGTSDNVMCGSDGDNDDSDGWATEGWYSAEYRAWYQVGSHPTDAHDGMIYPTHFKPMPTPPIASGLLSATPEAEGE